MVRPLNLIGKRFGRLRIISRDVSKQGKSVWLCKCDCGNEVLVTGHELTRKPPRGTKSCGCLVKEGMSKAKTTHGMSRHPAFAVWSSMKRRCNCSTQQSYHNYGARGIYVCKEWNESFENFWNDMKDTYVKGLDLDRINNDDGYYKGNCRWTTRKINTRNRRVNRIVNFEGREMTVNEAAEISGVGNTTLHYRLQHDWPEDKLYIKPDFTNRITR